MFYFLFVCGLCLFYCVSVCGIVSVCGVRELVCVVYFILFFGVMCCNDN